MTLRFLLTVGLIFFLLNSISYGQIKDCELTYFDSNQVIKSYSHVNLISLNSDTLLFSETKSMHKLHINSLIEIKHSVSRSHWGFIIGGAVGFAAGVTVTAILSGRGFTGHGPKASIGEIIGAGAFLGIIGGLIGGWIQGSPAENFKVNFMDLSLNQKRKEVKNIFKEFSNPNEGP